MNQGIKVLNMKDFLKYLLNSSDLYKKELKVICAMLLCFAISGVCLPIVKDQLPPSEPTETQLPVSNSSKKESGPAKTKKTDLKNGSSKSKKNTKSTEKDKKKEDNKEDNKKDNTEKAKSSENVTANKTSNDAAGTASQKPAAGNSDNTLSGNTSSENSASAPSAQPAPSAPQTPAPTPVPETPKEPVWVPPVYTTVHHEAVYETIQVVCCNYCGATFNSVGEFQVHKDANGG